MLAINVDASEVCISWTLPSTNYAIWIVGKEKFLYMSFFILLEIIKIYKSAVLFKINTCV